MQAPNEYRPSLLQAYKAVQLAHAPALEGLLCMLDEHKEAAKSIFLCQYPKPRELLNIA